MAVAWHCSGLLESECPKRIWVAKRGPWHQTSSPARCQTFRTESFDARFSLAQCKVWSLWPLNRKDLLKASYQTAKRPRNVDIVDRSVKHARKHVAYETYS